MLRGEGGGLVSDVGMVVVDMCLCVILCFCVCERGREEGSREA